MLLMVSRAETSFHFACFGSNPLALLHSGKVLRSLQRGRYSRGIGHDAPHTGKGKLLTRRHSQKSEDDGVHVHVPEGFLREMGGFGGQQNGALQRVFSGGSVRAVNQTWI